MYAFIQKITSTTLQNMLYPLCGAILLCLTSMISIPLEPVPITLQTVGVMIIGLTFERKHAINAVLIYLLIGAMGAPVFSNYQGGLPLLFGARGGYLWGFLIAIILMTFVQQYLNNRNLFHLALNGALGTITILTMGVLWLAYFIGIKPAMTFGLYPFIIPGLLKIVISAVAVRYILISNKNKQ